MSAVESLVNHLTEYGFNLKLHKAEIKQAKELEKQQIIDAWLSAWKDSVMYPLEDKYYKPEAEQYYNETYGKQNNEE